MVCVVQAPGFQIVCNQSSYSNNTFSLSGRLSHLHHPQSQSHTQRVEDCPVIRCERDCRSASTVVMNIRYFSPTTAKSNPVLKLITCNGGAKVPMLNVFSYITCVDIVENHQTKIHGKLISISSTKIISLLFLVYADFVSTGNIY